jgi:ubiquinone/menaquinone biosynthesis C-methylase UbiE
MIRCRTPEMIDAPSLDTRAHAHALQSLNLVNRLLAVDRGLYAAVERLGPADRLSVLDLGTGGGSFLGYLFRRRGGRSMPPLLGLDFSTFALTQAEAWYDGAVRPVVADARKIPLAENSVDVVTCSLFLHHFDEADVLGILREAARVARRGVVVSDLSRSRLALVLTWITTRVISRSRVFHVDGPKSVRAAFRRGELAELAARAGLAGACVWRRFPFRLMLVWRKPGRENDSEQ